MTPIKFYAKSSPTGVAACSRCQPTVRYQCDCPATTPCGACGKPSHYFRKLDAFIHEDGSDNQHCWWMYRTGAV